MTKTPLMSGEGVVTVEFGTAHDQTKNYREFMKAQGLDVIAFFIRKEDLLSAMQLPQELSGNSDISGVRIYMAMKELEDGKRRNHVYVVATDQDLNDITRNSEDKSMIYDMTWPCPNLCSTPNVLNSDDPAFW
jgi:hypothetical protein